MNFINKQYSWYNISFSFFLPFCNLWINLISNLLINFSSVSTKQIKKSLLSRINNIYFMKCDCMHYFLSLLYFSLWTLYKSCLRSQCIKFTGFCKRSTQFTNSSRNFINGDNISSSNFFLCYGFNHFST